LSRRLITIAERSRNLKGHGLDEGASTRMLVHAAQLVAEGVPLGEACQVALVLPITDDPDMRDALTAAIAACS
jgi:nitric oxide reductase NorQ protein